MQSDATLLANNSQRCWMSLCVRLHTLLHVFACCWRCCVKFETHQTFSPVQTEATLLRPFARRFAMTIKVVNNNIPPQYHEEGLCPCSVEQVLDRLAERVYSEAQCGFRAGDDHVNN